VAREGKRTARASRHAGLVVFQPTSHRPDAPPKGGTTWPIFLLDPVTDVGRDWIEAHISEDATWFGGGVGVEHRYIRDTVVGAVTDELRVR
jgi:hypothetical protein